MRKSRIVGVACKASVKDFTANRISLLQSDISKVYYVSVDGDDTTKLSYATNTDFMPPNNADIDPDNYAPSRIFVNCFLAQAKLSTGQVVCLPRVGTGVPIFSEDSEMLLLGTTVDGMSYVYINKELGTICLPSALLKDLETVRSFDDIENIEAKSLVLGQKGLEVAIREIESNKLSFMGIKETSLLDIDEKTVIEEWAIDRFLELFELSDWYSDKGATDFDLVCKEFADGPKACMSKWQYDVVYEVFSNSFGLPEVDKNGAVIKIKQRKLLDKSTMSNTQQRLHVYQLNEESKFVKRLAYRQEVACKAVKDFWDALVGQRECGYFGRRIKRTDLSVNSFLGVEQENAHTLNKNGTAGSLDRSSKALDLLEIEIKENLLGTVNNVAVDLCESDDMTETSVVPEVLGSEKSNIVGDISDITDIDEPTVIDSNEEPYKGLRSLNEELMGNPKLAVVIRDEVVPANIKSELTDKQKDGLNKVLSSLVDDCVPNTGTSLKGTATVVEGEEEILSLLGEARERVSSQFITNTVKNTTGRHTELESMATNECFKDCSICGGRGVYEEQTFHMLATCPNKSRFIAEKNSGNVVIEQIQGSFAVKQAVTQGLVPKRYWEDVWNPEKSVEGMCELANAVRLEVDTREAQEYKKSLGMILGRLITNKVPEHSYLVSAPNGSGKAYFAYTAIKLLVLHGKKATPYVTLIELAELRKRYLLWAGNLSQKELAVNKATEAENYSTEEFSSDSSVPLEEMTQKQKEEYLKEVRKVDYKYTDFLNSDFLICSMSSDKAQLTLEISVLKSILEYRAKRCKPTLVFTELLMSLSSLEYEYAYGNSFDGLITCTTKSRDYADYDRLLVVSVKPKRLKV